MRKVLSYFIFFFILTFFNISCLAKSTLELADPVISIPKIKGYSLQGFTTINNNLFMVLEGYDDTESIIKVYNLDTYREIKSYKFYSLGHANDVTYNKNNNTIYVIHGSGYNDVYTFNGDTFEYIDKFEVNLPIRSIAYIEDTNEYAVRTISVGYKYDSNFNLISKFPFIIGMTFGFDIGRQGWTYYDGYIYYSNWSWIRKGGDGSNVIYVYDYDGNKVNSLYTDVNIGELENVAFYNNKMILGFNSYSSSYDFYMIDNPVIYDGDEGVEEIVKLEVVEKNNAGWIFLSFFTIISICFLIIIRCKKRK